MGTQYQRSSDGLPLDDPDKVWVNTSADYCVRTMRHHKPAETEGMEDEQILGVIADTGVDVASLQLRAVVVTES